MRSALQHGLDEATNWLLGRDSPTRPIIESADFNLIRIESLATFWRDDLDVFVRQHRAFVAAQFGRGSRWCYLLRSHGGQIEVLYGFFEASNKSLSNRAIEAAFPGARIAKVNTPLQHLVSSMPFVEALTGNPSVEPEVGVESLIRLLYGEEWAWLVLAEPRVPATLNSEIEFLTREAREAKAEFQPRGTTLEENNPQAAYYLQLLEATLNHRRICLRHGGWSVCAALFASNRAVAHTGANELVGAYALPESHLPAFQTRLIDNLHFPTFSLTNDELGAITRPPHDEFAGFQVTEAVSFSSNPPIMRQQERIAVGGILDGERLTSHWFEVGRDDLSKHTLICGVTGSGKSSTCRWLLLQLWKEHRIPFLVIEPGINPSYRSLLASEIGNDLRVFTVGNENIAPLRLNPLAVPKGIPAQQHIDAIFNLFSGSFSLHPPLPYVLRDALQRVYVERGWDLIRGTPPPSRPNDAPQMADLLHSVQSVIQESRWSGELRQNVIASLEVRLRSLTFGSKGLLFSASDAVPFESLLEKPTVLEFDALTDDDEKLFVVGILLIRVAQHWRRMGLSQGRLRHITVVEEAHRLLRAAVDTAGTEIANPRGRVVALFSDMLAELRGFGAGWIIAEQVPAKLAPEVIKNTNLKILHRLVAKDDRDLVGSTANLTEDQQRKLARLSSGEAVAYAEGSNSASLVRVPNPFRNQALAIPSDTFIRDSMIQHMPMKTNEPDRDLKPCPGCLKSGCEFRMQLLSHLDEADINEAFDAALGKRWETLWAVGKMWVASHFSSDRIPEAAFCGLLCHAETVGMHKTELDRLRSNLGELLIRELKRNNRS